jgi:ATP-dependent RNA helicase DeaD
MINKGFLQDIKKILAKIPEKRQTLFFSATVSDEVERFAQKFAKNPVLITSKNDDLPSNTEHYYIETTSSRQKKHDLISFLSANQSESVIVFANTKRKVEEIKNTLLDNRLRVDYIHSDLSQNRRTRVFQKFRGKKISLLIATDVAARGLDIKDISYVVNYDFPQNREFYIHRTGRTGRAGASGKAITFVNSSREKSQLLAIARQRNFKVERFTSPMR